MPRCFKFQVQECQNTSIETWIRDIIFDLKIPICSENMEKSPTEFQQSGIFLRAECTPYENCSTRTAVLRHWQFLFLSNT